ncbi:MAG: zinc ribbon domain-containing protein [Candidatus Bathyarchaeia archaeon]
MTKCTNCGFNLPRDAAFCPNCGAPVRKVIKAKVVQENISWIIRLSLIGAFLSLIIYSIGSVIAENVSLYFIPTFVSALIIIYTSRTKSLKDAITISVLIYLFTNAILSGLTLGIIYIQGEKLVPYYENFPTLIDVILYPITPLTSILAGFIGSKIAPERIERPYEYPMESGPMLFYGIKRGLKKLKYSFFGFFIEAR